MGDVGGRTTEEASELTTAILRGAEDIIREIRDHEILMLAADGTIVGWNAGAELVRGSPLEDLVGQPYEILFTAEDRASGHPADVLRRARADGRFREEGWRQRTDGGRFWAEVVVSPILDSGELLGYTAVARDLTDRLAAEEAKEAAARSDRQLLDVLGSISDGVMVLDAGGRYTFVNRRFCEISGQPRSAFLGKHPLEPNPELRDHPFYTTFRSVMERRAPAEVEAFFPAVNGWFDVRLIPTEDGGVFVYVRDVTDRKMAAEARAEADLAERRFSDLISTMPEGFAAADPERRLTYANEAFARFFGLRPDELVGRTFRDVLGPPPVEVEDTARRVRDEKALLDVEVPHGNRWLHARLFPAPDGGVAAFVRDTTERHEAAAALAESEARFRALFESAAEAIVVAEGDGTIRMANGQAETLFRAASGELVGLVIEDLVPVEVQGQHLVHRREFLAAPRTRPMGSGIDVEGVRRDGSRVPVEVSLSWVDTSEGPLTLAYVTDITERRRLTRELERIAEERRELLGALVGAQEEERRRIAQDLHDGLGQVLASLALFATGLEREVPDVERPKVARFRRRVEDATAQMRELVSSFRPVELDSSGLGGALEAMIIGLDLHEGLSADLHVDLGDLRLMPGVEASIFRIVQEATTNALRHGRPSTISVAVTRTEGSVTTVIEDDGIGFDPHLVPRGSHGLLGMRERAGFAGGSVSIDSSPGVGTTVRVEIPIAR